MYHCPGCGYPCKNLQGVYVHLGKMHGGGVTDRDRLVVRLYKQGYELADIASALEVLVKEANHWIALDKAYPGIYEPVDEQLVTAFKEEHHGKYKQEIQSWGPRAYSGRAPERERRNSKLSQIERQG